jgi:hypothetical protein
MGYGYTAAQEEEARELARAWGFSGRMKRFEVPAGATPSTTYLS